MQPGSFLARGGAAWVFSLQGSYSAVPRSGIGYYYAGRGPLRLLFFSPLGGVLVGRSLGLVICALLQGTECEVYIVGVFVGRLITV